jgi:hypothetical protein
VTIVPIPAFQEAFLALGHEFLADLPEEAKAILAAGCGCNDGPDDDENPDVELGYDSYAADYVAWPGDLSASEQEKWLTTMAVKPEQVLGVSPSFARRVIALGSEELALAEDQDQFRNYDAADRKRMAGNGQALPDGSFPIADEEDLKNAIQAIGRASDPAAARAHIKKRARALGKSSLIPEEWGADVIDLTGLDAEALALYDADPEKYIDEHLEVLIASGAFAPGTKDGPGWITHPIPTARIRRYWVRGKGAAKIRWGVPGDFNRCRRQLAKYVQNPEWLAGLCANMHKEAIGVWPGRETGRGHSLVASGEPAPIFNLVAAATYVFDANLFARPEMETPRVGVVVDGDHVYGYIAQWGVCHIGISGICTEAPPSQSEYWYYATGVVDTTEGPVHVGQITMDTGHASLRANAKVAAAHYDNTGSAVADIAVGEDAYGIWFSGVMRKSATDDQRHALRASGRLSGDWRQIGRDLELVAALAVNVPGFPIPHARAGVYNGEQVSLVAAGLDIEESPLVETFSADQVAGIVRTAVAELRHQEKIAAKAAPIRDALRAKQIESLRARMKE